MATGSTDDPPIQHLKGREMITTKDGIELDLVIGQVITDPAECDLIGCTFSDARITGVVQCVELTRRENGMLEPKLWFGQNYINAWDAFQACQACFSPMETVEHHTISWSNEPPVRDENYQCSCCGRKDEQAQGNVPEIEVPF